MFLKMHMFVIMYIFNLVILCIFDQAAGLVTLPKVEENDIVKTEAVIRKTINAIFSSLNLTNIRNKTWTKQYSLIINYFVSLTLQDYKTLKEIVKLTRVDKSDIENVTTNYIALINEVLDKDNNTIKLNKDFGIEYNIESDIEKLKLLKNMHAENKNKAMDINKDVLKILQQSESLDLNVSTTTKSTVDYSNENILDENTFWYEADEPLSGRRIYNGKHTKIKHFPFMASIQIFNKFQCAGSIISEDLVITAASCLQLAWNNRFFRENPPFLSVRVGSSFYEIGGERIGVQEIYFNPGYNPGNLRNNIAIVRLERKLSFKKKKIKKVHLDKRDNKLPKKTGMVEIVGWGASSRSNILYGPWENKLKQAFLPIYPHKECRDIYSKEYVQETNFCGGFMASGTGACNRDIGGPGIISNILTGIISFGSPNCGTPDAPTVFTKVGFYYDWIEEIMEQNVPFYKKKTTLLQQTWSYPEIYTNTSNILRHSTPDAFKLLIKSVNKTRPANNTIYKTKLKNVDIDLFKDYLTTMFKDDEVADYLEDTLKKSNETNPKEKSLSVAYTSSIQPAIQQVQENLFISSAVTIKKPNLFTKYSRNQIKQVSNDTNSDDIKIKNNNAHTTENFIEYINSMYKKQNSFEEQLENEINQMITVAEQEKENRNKQLKYVLSETMGNQIKKLDERIGNMLKDLELPNYHIMVGNVSKVDVVSTMQLPKAAEQEKENREKELKFSMSQINENAQIHDNKTTQMGYQNYLKTMIKEDEVANNLEDTLKKSNEIKHKEKSLSVVYTSFVQPAIQQVQRNLIISPDVAIEKPNVFMEYSRNQIKQVSNDTNSVVIKTKSNETHTNESFVEYIDSKYKNTQQITLEDRLENEINQLLKAAEQEKDNREKELKYIMSQIGEITKIQENETLIMGNQVSKLDNSIKQMLKDSKLLNYDTMVENVSKVDLVLRTDSKTYTDKALLPNLTPTYNLNDSVSMYSTPYYRSSISKDNTYITSDETNELSKEREPYNHLVQVLNNQNLEDSQEQYIIFQLIDLLGKEESENILQNPRIEPIQKSQNEEIGNSIKQVLMNTELQNTQKHQHIKHLAGTMKSQKLPMITSNMPKNILDVQQKGEVKMNVQIKNDNIMQVLGDTNNQEKEKRILQLLEKPFIVSEIQNQTHNSLTKYKNNPTEPKLNNTSENLVSMKPKINDATQSGVAAQTQKEIYFDKFSQSLADLLNYSQDGHGLQFGTAGRPILANPQVNNGPKKQKFGKTLQPFGESQLFAQINNPMTQLYSLAEQQKVAVFDKISQSLAGLSKYSPDKYPQLNNKPATNDLLTSEISEIAHNFERIKKNLQTVIALLELQTPEDSSDIQTIYQRAREDEQDDQNDVMEYSTLKEKYDVARNEFAQNITSLFPIEEGEQDGYITEPYTKNEDGAINKVIQKLSAVFRSGNEIDEPEDQVMEMYRKLLKNDDVLKNKITQILISLLSESKIESNVDHHNTKDSYYNLINDEKIAKNKISKIITSLLSDGKEKWKSPINIKNSEDDLVFRENNSTKPGENKGGTNDFIIIDDMDFSMPITKESINIEPGIKDKDGRNIISSTKMNDAQNILYSNSTLIMPLLPVKQKNNSDNLDDRILEALSDSEIIKQEKINTSLPNKKAQESGTPKKKDILYESRFVTTPFHYKSSSMEPKGTSRKLSF